MKTLYFHALPPVDRFQWETHRSVRQGSASLHTPRSPASLSELLLDGGDWSTGQSRHLAPPAVAQGRDGPDAATPRPFVPPRPEERRFQFTFSELLEALGIWKAEFGDYESIPECFEVPHEGEVRGVDLELAALREKGWGAPRRGAGLGMVRSADADAAAAADARRPAAGAKEKDGKSGKADARSRELGSFPGLDDMFKGLDASIMLDEFDELGEDGFSADGSEDDDRVFGQRSKQIEDKRTTEQHARADAIAATVAAAKAAEAAAEAVKVAELQERVKFMRRVNAIKWPSRLGGFQLHSVVQQLRRGDIKGKFDFADRRPKLDAIGFTWGDETKYLHFNFEKLYDALRFHFRYFGHLCVGHDFVVPSTPLWPLRFHGYNFGREINVCRAQKDLLANGYPDRMSLLNGLSFMWLPPLLIDGEPAPDDGGEFMARNQAAIANLTAHQYRNTPFEWAKIYYEEVLDPNEWVDLRHAMERGFKWDREAIERFGLEEMDAVEALHPEDYRKVEEEDGVVRLKRNLDGCFEVKELVKPQQEAAVTNGEDEEEHNDEIVEDGGIWEKSKDRYSDEKDEVEVEVPIIMKVNEESGGDLNDKGDEDAVTDEDEEIKLDPEMDEDIDINALDVDV